MTMIVKIVSLLPTMEMKMVSRRTTMKRGKGARDNGMVPQGPEAAASVGSHGAQHLQVMQQIVVNWGNIIVGGKE